MVILNTKIRNIKIIARNCCFDVITLCSPKKSLFLLNSFQCDRYIFVLHCIICFIHFFYCRATTEECPLAIIVMSTQSIIGVIIQACMAGIIFAKFTVPRKRGQTLVFSKNAVITMRNGSLYLISRVCDLRKSALLEAHVRMVIIKKEVTDEGELL